MSESVTTFYAPLEYSIDGSRHTVVCEGTWTDDGDVTRLRLDSEHFPAFWQRFDGRSVENLSSQVDMLPSIPHIRPHFADCPAIDADSVIYLGIIGV